MTRFPSRLAATPLTTSLAVALVLSIAHAAETASNQDDAGFVPIFNGETLEGWEGNPDLWSVEDGAITGRTSNDDPLEYNQFLIWKGGKVRDFELRATFRLVGDNNSGIQYRSRVLPDAGEHVVAGYQADIHPNPDYLGMLYEERGRGILAQNGERVVIEPNGDKRLTGRIEDVPTDLDLEDWNELAIVARGPRLIHRINGVTVADITDNQESARSLEGVLALQVHRGPAMTVQFKDLQLKDLSNDQSESARRSQAAAKAQAETKDERDDETPAILADRVEAPEGFQVERLYDVPSEEQGSWVAMTVAPEGRLIVSDQYGKLFWVTPPAVGEAGEIRVEPIDVEIGEAQGLLWAFDSLYVMVNTGGTFQSGFYRVTDSDDDGALDHVEQLRALQGRGEHGPHAIIPSPDGETLHVICGNATDLTAYSSTVVPPVWGEDHLLPTMPDGNGFMAGRLAPGGCVYKVDPDGRDWELVSIGYRNPYDIAFNRDGELFTYDADMEWDVNTPWYRPTRVCHVTSGSDFGWRNGAGKWPPYYLDSLPAAVDIGPGSPTGIVFGYGARFPARYQNALYICDWSYGKLYAVHLEPDGASYTGTFEEFLSGTPLPLTDIVIHPGDGAMYFTTGGRRTSSALYRVTYVGNEPTDPVETQPAEQANERSSPQALRALRQDLESLHGGAHPEAVDRVWPHLNHKDHFIHYAARVALEFQDPDTWTERALAEEEPLAALNALLALVRVSAPDPKHREPGDPPIDEALKSRIRAALDRLPFEELPVNRRLDYLRVQEVFFNRMGPPDAETRRRLIERFDPHYPAGVVELNAQLCRLLVYLEAPSAAEKTVALLEAAPTQEEQIDYARALRLLKTGWTPELRERYFRWFLKAASYKGGSSFTGFVNQIKQDAIKTLSEDERLALRPILEAEPVNQQQPVGSIDRPFVKDWTIEDLAPKLGEGLADGRDYDRGRQLFAETTCFSCHRFAGEGGAVGPDLTGVAGRFTPEDLLESLIEPSKTISDQYEATMFALEDGRVVTGRIVNLNGDRLMVMPNMLDPNGLIQIERGAIEEMQPSPVSMMPEDLLNTLTEEEVLDLMAYLLSRGNREAPMFE